MKIFEINVQEPYYEYILSKEKKIEGRLNKGKFKEMRAGDYLLINNKSKFKIKRKNIYNSFRDMIEKEGVKNVIPNKQSIKEAVNI